MTDIVEFLTARLDEDEAGALATTPAPGCPHWRSSRWRAARDKGAAQYAPLYLVQIAHEDDDGTEYNSSSPVIAFNTLPQEFAVPNIRHTARHDPARVLREVKAKRAILAEVVPALVDLEGSFQDENDTGEDEGESWHEASALLLRLLAAPYADHPDYKQEWQVG